MGKNNNYYRSKKDLQIVLRQEEREIRKERVEIDKDCKRAEKYKEEYYDREKALECGNSLDE